MEVTLLVETALADLIAEQNWRGHSGGGGFLTMGTQAGRQPRATVAAPSYLERAGIPHPEDWPSACLLWTRDNRVYDRQPLSMDGSTTLVRVQAAST